jgi:Nucleotidyl transferase AbiEii toxin, Type IV TA system
VSTFALDELLSTKLRALYQRRKGRDLFDLWDAMVALDPDDAQIVAGLAHYMGDDAFTYPQLAQNLKAKLGDRNFAGDLTSLVTVMPDGYALEAAADLVMERLGLEMDYAQRRKLEIQSGISGLTGHRGQRTRTQL